MNVGDVKGVVLERTVQEFGPAAQILELGSFVGYSSILMARQLANDGRIVSVDSSEKAFNTAREMATLADVDSFVQFVNQTSGDFLRSWESTFDLVFLDHLKNLYLDDAKTLIDRRLLNPGAAIVADNVGPLFGHNPYVPWMRSREDFDSRYVESHLESGNIIDGMLVSRWIGDQSRRHVHFGAGG